MQKYFDEINQDTGKYCFMVDDTLKGLDLGAVETLIVWDNLDINRYTTCHIFFDIRRSTPAPLEEQQVRRRRLLSVFRTEIINTLFLRLREELRFHVTVGHVFGIG